MRSPRQILLTVLILVVLLAGIAAWLLPKLQKRGLTGGGYVSPQRSARVMDFLTNPGDHPDWLVQANARCGGAPFQFPTTGYIGFLWDDSFQPGHAHQGLDIFGGTDVGVTPVYAAYGGYLTREAGWKSSVIIRIPADPLNPSRQIWTYYTHLADPDGGSLIDAAFPPGTVEMPIEAGTLLGYQGNFSGTPGAPTGVHLHFSVVLDDGAGRYTNELMIENTLDPTPYLGIPVNAGNNPPDIPLCPAEANEGRGS